MEFALFLTGGLWVLAAHSAADHAASGFAVRLHFDIYTTALVAAAFFVFLLLTGFTAINWIATRDASVRAVNALPARPTVAHEWKMGAALGWALLVISLIPMVLMGALHPTFWVQPRAFVLTLLVLLTLLLVTLAEEAIFRGYIFSRLIRAMGPTMATILMSAIAAASSAFHPQSTRLSVFVTFLMSILLSLAYLRTRALWLPWGLHFAWSASAAIIFGLPVAGSNGYTAIVDTSAFGPTWLSGGLYGPEGALFTAVVMLGGMFALFALTRDLAWKYTQPEIQPAGYAMDVAPPAEHVAMEKAAAPAPLVQILSTTPSAASTVPVIEEHLRATQDHVEDGLL